MCMFVNPAPWTVCAKTACCRVPCAVGCSVGTEQKENELRLLRAPRLVYYTIYRCGACTLCICVHVCTCLGTILHVWPGNKASLGT